MQLPLDIVSSIVDSAKDVLNRIRFSIVLRLFIHK